MQKANVDEVTINILMEIEGKVYMVAMTQDNLDAISLLVKTATTTVIPTKKTQSDLREFLFS